MTQVKIFRDTTASSSIENDVNLWLATKAYSINVISTNTVTAAQNMILILISYTTISHE